jgi:hypothetical protein
MVVPKLRRHNALVVPTSHANVPSTPTPEQANKKPCFKIPAIPQVKIAYDQSLQESTDDDATDQSDTIVLKQIITLKIPKAKCCEK